MKCGEDAEAVKSTTTKVVEVKPFNSVSQKLELRCSSSLFSFPNSMDCIHSYLPLTTSVVPLKFVTLKIIRHI